MRRLETPQYQFALRDEGHLRSLFERVLREPRGAAQESHTLALHEGVCSLVQRAKAEGRHVETVIVALKDIFGVPDRPNRAFRGDEDTPPNVQLVRRVVRWCIHEYYGPGTDVPVTER
jgi:CRISPR/Cas system CSM-associated protein Csm3 (group 7 of RAMP superfamily)